VSMQPPTEDPGEAPATAFERRWGISRAELERRAYAHHLDADGPRERFCEECGNRVTRTREQDDAPEAGHAKGDRPDEAPCSQLMHGDP